MKFTKTALAVAIAGIAAAPIAQADVSLSGVVSIKLQDADNGPELSILGDDNLLQLSASHAMDSGLTAYGSYRLDVNEGTKLSGKNVNSDQIWVGMKGGFGDLRFGEVPDASEYGQVAGDILKDVGGENAGISYTGSFGPVGLGVNWSPEGSTDVAAVGVKFGLGGFAIGLGTSFSDNDANVDTSIGASFAIAGFSVALAAKDLDDGTDGSVGAKIGYGIGGFSLGLTFESDTEGAGDGDSAIRFDAGYGLGGGMKASFRAQVNSFDDSNTDDTTLWRLMLAKSF